MDETTQQNAALVEQAAAAAESLVEQAGSLIEVVSVFKLYVTSAAPNRQPSNSLSRKPNATQSRPVASKPVLKSTSARVVTKTGTDDAADWEEF